MAEQIGVFVDGEYLLSEGMGLIAENNPVDNATIDFNVGAFTRSVVSMAKRMFPGRRVLRIYWYEQPYEDDEDELDRKLSRASNGIKVRTVSSTDENVPIDSTIQVQMASDIEKLIAHRTVSNVLIVAKGFADTDVIEKVQEHGVRFHVSEIARREASETVDLRLDVDTFTQWPIEELKKFLTVNLPIAEESEEGHLESVENESETLSGDHLVQGQDDEHDEMGDENLDSTDESRSTISLMQRSAPVQASSGIEELGGIDEFDEFDSADYEDVTPYVREYAEKELNDQAIQDCVQYWARGNRDIPSIHDKSILAVCRAAIQRTLTPDERRIMRSSFQDIVNDMFQERGLTTEPGGENFAKNSSIAPQQRAYRSFESGFNSAFSSRYDLNTSLDEVDEDEKSRITEYVEIYVSKLGTEELSECLNFWNAGKYGVPSMFDKDVMGLCRQELQRHLHEQEKYFMRSEFKRIAEEVSGERGIAEDLDV